MPYKYNKEKNILEEQPEMKEPECELAELDANAHPEFAERLIIEWNQYNEQKAKCKTYPVPGNCNWVDGQILEEGKDWKKVVICENGQRCECTNTEAERCLYSKFVVIPIEENKLKPFDLDLLHQNIIETFPLIEENKKVEEEKNEFMTNLNVDAVFGAIYKPKKLEEKEKEDEVIIECPSCGKDFKFPVNKLVECKEKEDQDELWLDIAMWHNSANSYKDFVDKCKANFSISKK